MDICVFFSFFLFAHFGLFLAPHSPHTSLSSLKQRTYSSMSSKKGSKADAPVENPYLAHLPPRERIVGGEAAARKTGASSGLAANHPLASFVMGSTTAEQGEAAEEGPLNPFTNKPFSDKYRRILAGRRKLPVNKHRKEFLDLVQNNQVVILVGETGSGKTTQYVPIAPKSYSGRTRAIE